ncbi:extensin-like isoform X2 [Varroa jacobsoni]|uniref:extensin-like isoform X2 n=1 Tax=Varroa jacobsoni TaxID=62625 RepID=UPI000BF52F3D|nr:extensin-like isoform X2 [Varroa jacobsoni]
MSNDSPAPPPPPPPPPGWKPNWREERGKDEVSTINTNVERSAPIKIPGIGPAAVAANASAPQSPKPTSGSGPDGSFTQYDRLPEKLQSTLSKDKKPFTYTPAGIDLSEIKSPNFQKKVNRAKQQGEFSPVCGPGSPGLNEYGQQPPLWPEDIHISEYCNNPAELDESMTNPRYTGSKIPSRSFKVLQAITATSDDDYASSPEPTHNKPLASSPRSAPPPPPTPASHAPTIPAVLPVSSSSPYVSTPPLFSPSSSRSYPPSMPPPPSAPASFSLYGAPSSGSFSSIPPPVPPPPSAYLPSSSPTFASSSQLYSQPTPNYKKVPPPVPPKPPRGVFRDGGVASSLPSTPLASSMALPPPFSFSSRAPQAPSAPPVHPTKPLPSSSFSNEYPTQKQPFSEQFYQSTVNPVFKTYTPPPSVRQTVRCGPGFKETATHKTGSGFEETTTYSSYSSPSYSDGTRTLPLRREIKSSTSKSSFKSRPYYESPYQTLLETPQFQDPFKFGGLTPSYTNSYANQLSVNQERSSPSLGNEPVFAPLQSPPPPFQPGINRQSATTSSYEQTIRQTTTNQSERPLSMTSRFFDEINQMFDQTSANISREMYGTDF